MKEKSVKNSLVLHWAQLNPLQKFSNFVGRKWAKLSQLSLRAIINQIDLELDYLTFRWRYKNILSKKQEFADPEKKVLILSFSNYVAQIKAEAFIAKVLQLHGFTPVIVTNSSVQRILKYYRVFGITQFEFFDEYLNSKVSQQAIEEANAFFQRSLTVQDIKQYEFHGTRLGAHILRSFTRSAYKGSLDLSDANNIDTLKAFMLRGMHNVEHALVLLKKMQPQLILTHHPQNLGEGDIFEVGLQLGIDTIFWNLAQKDGHWIFKRYTKDVRNKQLFSISDETWELAQQMNWDDIYEKELKQEIDRRYQVNSTSDLRRLQDGKVIKTKEEVQKQLGLDPLKKTAVVFSHIVWDTSFLYGEDLFSTYEEWLIETTRVACQNSDVNWIIKLHPANQIKMLANRVEDQEPGEVIAIRKELGDLPSHVKLLYPDTDINTFSLFALTDYCLTVRGTIGIEMPCFGIPVITAGTGHYSGCGFTFDSNSIEEYFDKLRNIQDIPPLTKEQIVLAKKHAFWLFNLRPVKFDFIRKYAREDLFKNATHPLATNIQLKLDSLDDLISSSMLNNFAHWALHDRSIDLLAVEFVPSVSN